MQKKLFNRYFILIWLGSLCLLLIQNTMCTVIPLFLQELGFSTSFSGLLGIPFAVFGIAARITGGRLMDGFSRRAIMIAGTLLMGIASFLFRLFPVAVLLLLLRGAHGAGFSLGQAAFSTASVDVTPREKSSLGVGIFWMSTAVSMACTGYLIQLLTGDGTYDKVFSACLIFGVAGACFAFFCRYEAPGAGISPADGQERGRGPGRFLEPSAAKPALIEFFVMLGVSCCNIFILTFAADQGYQNASVFLLISAVSMAASNLSSDRLIQKLGSRNLLALTMAASGILTALIALVPCPATYYLGGIGFGMSQGFSFPVLTILAVDGIPQNRRGTANSTMLMAGDVGMGIGTFLWGVVIDGSGYSAAYALAGAALIVSGILSLAFYRGKMPQA